jgi:hypothetical protein
VPEKLPTSWIPTAHALESIKVKCLRLQIRVSLKGEELNGYMLAMKNMDDSSPAAKIVGEELHAFFERARKRLNEIKEPASIEESNKEIQKLVEFHLVFPAAKTITGGFIKILRLVT